MRVSQYINEDNFTRSTFVRFLFTSEEVSESEYGFWYDATSEYIYIYIVQSFFYVIFFISLCTEICVRNFPEGQLSGMRTIKFH